MNQEKNLFNYLIIMLKICLKVFTNQNKELNKCFKEIKQIKAGNNSESLLNEIR